MNILLLDDRGSVTYYMSEVLKAKGHSVLSCVNNIQAIYYLNQNDHQIDLLIQDINRPPEGLKNIEDTQYGLMTGIVFYKEIISNSKPNLPVVFYSDYAREFQFQELNANNNIFFVSKRDGRSAEKILDIIDNIFEQKNSLYNSQFTDKQSHIIKVDFSSINNKLIKELNANPSYLYKLKSRQFEELIAYLLEKTGYEITLTQKTRDGGKDIYALKSTDLGDFLSVVECKKYAREHPVGVSIVRSLYGVKVAERANMGVVVTTSYFTKDSLEFKNQIGTELSLRDYDNLVSWLGKFNVNP